MPCGTGPSVVGLRRVDSHSFAAFMNALTCAKSTCTAAKKPIGAAFVRAAVAGAGGLALSVSGVQKHAVATL